MEFIDLDFVRNAAIIFIYSVLFGTASWEKFQTLKTPDWFIRQFDKTLLARFPRLIVISYWKVAAIEALLTIMFITALLVPGILPFALLLALFLFGVLCFGLRVLSEYQGSANMFIYFTATLLSLHLIR